MLLFITQNFWPRQNRENVKYEHVMIFVLHQSSITNAAARPGPMVFVFWCMYILAVENLTNFVCYALAANIASKKRDKL